jgi:acyl carrier protein
MTVNRAELTTWLMHRFPKRLRGVHEHQLPNVPVETLGLDSVEVFTLCGEVEARYGIDLDPQQLHDLQTLGELMELLVDPERVDRKV